MSFQCSFVDDDNNNNDENDQDRVSDGQLHGPRPAPLTVNKKSSAIKKPAVSERGIGRRRPVVVHLRSPKIIHASPREFMGIVQRLTGKEVSGVSLACNSSSSSSSFVTESHEVERRKRDRVLEAQW